MYRFLVSLTFTCFQINSFNQILFTSFNYFEASIYAWLIVFILPINPALNPIIYTIAAPTGFSEQFHNLLLNLEKICGFHSIHKSGSSKYSRASSEFTRTSNISEFSVGDIKFSEQLSKLIHEYELKEKSKLDYNLT